MSEENLNIITGLTEHERKNVFIWMGSLTEMERIEIVRKAVQISFVLKERKTDLESREQKYAAIVLSARKAGWDTKRGKGFRIAEDTQYKDFNNMRVAAVAGLLKKGRKPLLRKKTLAYWGEITQLQNEGAGFRVIAGYLKEKRKLTVSPSYLAQLWKEVNKKNGYNII